MRPATRSIGPFRNHLICLAAVAALCACGGDDDSGDPATNTNPSQNGSGGGHATMSGSGGSSAGNHASGGSGGTSATHGGSDAGPGNSGSDGMDAGATDHDAGSRCFSPTQNLDTAYEPGAVGCACADDDVDQCTGGVALICEGGQWRAVEDGPCEPTVSSMPLSYSTSECEAVGAVVLFDPGDGSLFRDGCPDGKRELGVINNSKDPGAGIPIEGALCCACGVQGGDCDQKVVACGARAGDTCGDDEFCAYVPGAWCGAADAEAVCQSRPTQCTGLDQKVCGCDGKAYANACAANAAGVGVTAIGACASQP